VLRWQLTARLNVLFSLIITFMLWSGLAAAQNNACNQNGVHLPECNFVTTPPISDTTGWALYCPAQEPYHWPGYWSVDIIAGPSYGFSVSENYLAESNGPKADFNIIDWFGGTVAVTAGCSPINPDGGCTGNGSCQPPPTGPGTCTISNQSSNCIGSGENKTCWSEYSDTCVDGNTVNNWWCTDAEVIRTCCFGC
jgi:hypothetical protein